MATGLADVALLRAIAVANWEGMQVLPPAPDPQYLFRAIGYETFDSPQRAQLADALFMQYFAFDADPVEELILATTNRDLLPLVQRIKAARDARVRVWTSGDLVRGTPYDGQVIQQPLDSLIGIRQTKNVALYIDFENIAISLSESGYVVNLDRLLSSFRHQGEAHGQIIDAYAYAPWRRGSLPPLLDEYGREITDDATTRFLEANINPVITLPGKNSADMKMAKDITSSSQHGDAADIYIIASGDRDFRETINTLRGRGKQVILWSVQGTISRHLQTDPTVSVEFIEDFALLQSHQAMMLAAKAQPADMPPPRRLHALAVVERHLSVRLPAAQAQDRDRLAQALDRASARSRRRHQQRSG